MSSSGNATSHPAARPGFAWRRFFLLWLSLAALLAFILWFFYRAQNQAALTLAQAQQREALALAQQVIASQLGIVGTDLLFLADQARASATPTQSVSPQLQQLFLDFARRKPLYARIRLLDSRGQARLTVPSERTPRTRVTADIEHKEPAETFIRNTLQLERDQIYISPFALSPGQDMQSPAVPAIRFASPIVDAQGVGVGVISLDYLGRRLLDRIRAFSSPAAGQLWLLNNKGYWILASRAEQQWGWQNPARAEQRFSSLHVQAWARMQAQSSGQFRTATGLYSYRTILPRTLVNPTAQINPALLSDESWTLVMFLPQSQLAAQNALLLRGLSGSFLGLAILLAMGAGLSVRHRSQRMQAESAIRASETLFRNLLESAPDAIVIVDQDGRIVLVNAQIENYFQYKRAELIGASIDKLVPERVRALHGKHRTAYFEDPHARAMGLGMALSGQRKDGSEFPVEISLSPLNSQTGAKVIAVIRDMTAHRQAESARLAAQQRYQELVTNLPVGVYRKTPGREGTFLEVNPAMVTMFEADSAESLLAHPVSDIHFDAASRLALSDKVIREGYVNQEEMQLITLRGRVFWGAITAAMQKDAAGNIYFDGIIEDISARRESQQRIEALNLTLQRRSDALESANAELEAFSYSVSHDLRTPLRALDGFSKLVLAQATNLDDKSQDYLNRIRRAAQHMGTLIDDLLNLARVTRSTLAQEPVDLSALAHDIIEELQKHEPQRQVQVEIEPGLSALGDKRLLRIALNNLISNAWKFTSAREGAHISFGSREENNARLYFIRDNGAGFDMAYAQNLFGVFKRLHDAHEFPGTGIGLATVQRIIRKHGGRIWAEGEVNKGACFFFTLGVETP